MGHSPLHTTCPARTLKVKTPTASPCTYIRGSLSYLLHSTSSTGIMIVLLAFLMAVASAAPQLEDRPIQILLDERSDSGDGNFNYNFETENGISMQVSGTPGAEGQTNMQGVYRFTLPDGSIAEVRFVADEGGYRAESPLIPTPHPMPAHALEQIRIAEEQRAAGITFDDQGRRLN